MKIRSLVLIHSNVSFIVRCVQRSSALSRQIGFIFVCTLALRLLSYVVLLHYVPSTFDPPPFGYEAVHIAQSLAAGHGFGAPFPGAGPTAWLTPVYPTLLAADVVILGSHSHAALVAAIFFNELCSALTVFPVFYAGRRISGKNSPAQIGVFAAWLWALHPLAMITAVSMIWYSTLSGFLGAMLLWSTLSIVNSNRIVEWVGYGLIWGAELMTNPSFLVLLPPALLWLASGRGGRAAKHLSFPALAGLVAATCCIPWTVRNFEVFHHFVPLRSNFGLEFWRYNHDGPPLHPFDSGTERTRLSVDGEPMYMHEKLHEATLWIGVHRIEFAKRCLVRAVVFWFGDEHPLQRFAHWGEWLSKARFISDWVLGFLLLTGLTVMWRKMRRYFWLLVSVPVLYPFVYYITLSSDAYRVPVDPILVLIAAAGLFFNYRIGRGRITSHQLNQN
jgi:hypothetical protein